MKKFNSGTIVMHTLVRLMVFRVRETIANLFSEKFESLYNSVSYDFNNNNNGLLYRVSQKKRNGAFSVHCELKVLFIFISLDRVSSAEENGT